MTVSISGSLSVVADDRLSEPVAVLTKPALRVLFFYPDFGQAGGIERMIVQTACWMKAQGRIEPIFVCSKGGVLHKQLLDGGFRVYGIPMAGWFMPSLRRTFDFLTWDRLQRVVLKEKPDIAHVHAGLIENLWFRRWDIPIVYSFHGYGTLYSLQQDGSSVSGIKRAVKSWGKRIIRALFRKTASDVDALLFVSEAERRRMIREGYIPWANCQMAVLHNGIPLASLRREAAQAAANPGPLKESLGIPANARCVTYINRLDTNKNPSHFIAVARYLQTQPGCEDLHFLLVGDGPLLDTVAKEAATIPKMRMLGYRTDTWSLLGITDLLVYPSRREGFGLGLVEAMAVGVPCVAYASEGVSEVLSGPGAMDSILAECRVPVDDLLALCQKAKAMLTTMPAELALLQEVGRQRADHFAAGRFMNGLESVYRGLRPLVSVLLPVYQGEKTVLGAVQSVLSQSYPYLELIVVDDGSRDGTLRQLAKITDPRMRVISQDNAGVAAARNTAFAASQGDYIAFIDADDRWLAGKLDAEVAVLHRHGTPGRPPVCMVYSGYDAVDDKDQLIHRAPVRLHSGNLAEAVLEDEGIFLPSTTLLHRDIYTTIGGFSGGCHHEDRAFFIMACQKFPAYPTAKRLTLYRQSPAGRCRSILTDFGTALQAEESIVETVRPRLTPEQAERLEMLQRRNLLYRFMMYDRLDHAETLHRRFFEHNPAMLALLHGKKGLLTRMALSSGTNYPYTARLIVQGIHRYLISPLWGRHHLVRTALKGGAS